MYDWNTYKHNLKTALVGWAKEVGGIKSNTQHIPNIDDAICALNKNTIDAFSAAVDILASNKTISDWIEEEQIRQTQKTLQNKIGRLQEIMIKCLDSNINEKGFTKDSNGELTRIYDLYDDNKHWIAEIKNKHNTTKGDDRSSSFEKLNAGLQEKGIEYKAYYVTILRKKPEKISKPFSPSDNKKSKVKINKNIIEIDGESFYKHITGDPDGLRTAYTVLIDVFNKLFNSNKNNTELNKIKKIIDVSLYRNKININTASIDSMVYRDLYHIKDKTAHSIVNYRNKKKFSCIEEITKVKGIGEKIFNEIKDYIEV